MKNEEKSLVMALVVLVVGLAIALGVSACQDDHVTNIELPSDTLPAIVVCDTTCPVQWCYREKKDGKYRWVCEAEKRDS